MSANNATIVAASLDSSQLEQSINALVSMVAKKTKEMADNFTGEVKRMEDAVKNLGNIKIDSGGTADGGSSRRTSKQKAEETQIKATTQAYNEQKASLDNMASAMQKASRIPSEMRMPDMAKSARESFQVFYKGFNEQARKLDSTIKAESDRLASAGLGRFSAETQAQLAKVDASIDQTRWKMNFLYQEEKRLNQEALRQKVSSVGFEQAWLKKDETKSARVREGERLIELEKERQRIIASDPTVQQLDRNIEQTRAKIQQLIADEKRLQSESLKQAVGSTELERLWNQKYATRDQRIAEQEKLIQLERERQSLVAVDPVRMQLANIDELRARHEKVLGIMRDETTTNNKVAQSQQEVTQTTQKTAQSAHQYTEEIRKQAQIIREMPTWKDKGYATINGQNFWNPDTSRLPKKERLTLEEQILKALQEQQTEERKAAQTQAEVAAETEKTSKAQKLVASEVVMTNEQMQKALELARKNAGSLGKQVGYSVPTFSAPLESAKSLSAMVKKLQSQLSAMNYSERMTPEGQRIAMETRNITREAQKLQSELSRPANLKEAFGLSETTLDNIAYKMHQLNSYKMGLSVTDPKSLSEMRQVNSAINRLKKQYDDLMGINNQMVASNTALGRSWNYMKNRLAFYFTVGASTQFVKSLIDIRGQYELLERSIGILIDSAQNGSRIFAELNSMAIKSPFTTMELGAAAKQLVAYDVAAKDVVDTTRRLADMAAAVGIPIERLTYALGQIKAYGYLNARDARMFANAGIPLVKELADRYTELEGRLVSTADVYDRIKKKAISYEDVLDTVNKMTDEGGKFFNFQEKSADTLKVRIANLTLAWNNMMNEMGKDNQGVLAGGLKMLKNVFEHWRDIYNLLLTIIVTLGILKTAQIIVLATTAMRIKENIALWTALEFAMRKSLGAAIVNNLKAIGSLLLRFANPLFITTAAITALGIAIGKVVFDYKDLIAANEAFNKSISDNAKENITSIEKFFEDYKKQFSNISGLNNADQEKLWERLQEEIEKTTKNAKEYVNILNDVERVSSRIRLGEDVLEQSKIMQRELQLLADSGTFNIGGGFANDSAAKDLQDYQKALNEIRQEYGSVNAAIEAHTIKSRKLMADYTTQRDEVRKELNDFVSKLDNAYMPDILGQSDDVRIQMANVRSFAESLRDAFIATEEGSKIGTDGIAILNSEIDKWITKQGIANNLIVNANGDFDEQRAKIEENKTAWEEFFRYISNKDKEYLDAAIKTNDLGSDEVRKIWDKAAEEMSKRSTTSYNLIQDQIAQLRNTPDIVINVVYKEQNKESADKQINEYQEKYMTPSYVTFNEPSKYIEERKRLTEVYGRFIKKEGESNVEWEKRLGQEYQDNIKNIESLNNMLKSSSIMSETDREAKENERKALEDYNKTLLEVGKNEGFNYDQFKKGGKGNKGGSKKDPVLDALKQEINLVEKLQGDYDKLTKSGASQEYALSTIRSAYGNTIKNINSQLNKFGLPEVASTLITGKDPNKALEHFKSTLDNLVKKGMLSLERSKEVEAVIQKFTLSAQTYNLDKITKGLNSELDRLKDEYELAVSLDADPELGNMFADWMGIDVNDLPRTASEYAERASKELNKYLKQNKANIELPNLLNVTDDDLRAFEEMKVLTDAQLENVRKRVQQARELQKKEVSDQIKDWDKLLEKYAEYEYKVNKIQNDSVKERVTFAQQFGRNEEEKSLALNLQAQILAATDPQERQKLIQQLQELVLKIAGDDKVKINLLAAIDISQQSQTAKAQFEEFQKTPEWITATGELSGMTNKAIGGLIKSLEKYKKSAKNLDPKQIKNINNALKNLYKEQRKGNPFGAIADMLDRAKERMVDVEPEMESIMKDILAIEDEIGDGKATEEQTKKIDELKERWQTLASVGDVSAQEWVAAITSVYDAVKGAIQLFDDLAKAIGGKNASDIEKVFGILDKAGQGAQIGASFGGYGAAIGAVAGALTGVITTFADEWSGNASITKKIEHSAVSIKKLENAYKSLAQASEDAYGVAEMGAKRLVIANKELQLSELKRQLYLEQSRKSKNKDESKIEEIKGQIIDLEIEISNATKEIVNDLLSISSVGDAAENLVSQMIDAFKKGEDYMGEYANTFEDMIDNMIMKAITGEVIGKRMEEIFKMVEQNATARAEQAMVSAKDIFDNTGQQYVRGWIQQGERLKSDTNTIEQWREFLNTIMTQANDEGKKVYGDALNRLNELYNSMIDVTPSDVDSIRNTVNSMKDSVKTEFEAWMDAFGITFGQDKEGTNLSALQAGIQGITEDTAGALEAYMNGVSQQVYLHSDLLTQIRDAVVGFNLDVQVATMSQILFQLQSSYLIQTSIRDTLQGWSNASGLAVRVEMA